MDTVMLYNEDTVMHFGDIMEKYKKYKRISGQSIENTYRKRVEHKIIKTSATQSTKPVYNTYPSNFAGHISVLLRQLNN